MLADQTITEEVSEDHQIDESELINIMVAFGVNGLYRRYDQDAKDLYNSYLKLPLHAIVGSWDHLDDHVKISVIQNNYDSLKAWISGGSYER